MAPPNLAFLDFSQGKLESGLRNLTAWDKLSLNSSGAIRPPLRSFRRPDEHAPRSLG